MRIQDEQDPNGLRGPKRCRCVAARDVSILAKREALAIQTNENKHRSSQDCLKRGSVIEKEKKRLPGKPKKKRVPSDFGSVANVNGFPGFILTLPK